MVERTTEELWRWSDGGRLPVVIDATSCTQGLLEAASVLGPESAAAGRLAELEILDSIDKQLRRAAGRSLKKDEVRAIYREFEDVFPRYTYLER